MKKRLFKISFRVHFKPDHHKADQFAFGVLFVFIYGQGKKDAVAKAETIASILSFETGNAVICPFDKIASPNSFEKSHAANAETSGFSLALLEWLKGSDETKELGNWPLLIPYIHAN